ncbi:MAG: DNA topoisomerase, partial [Burkholderiaceae bacterium]
MTSKSPTTGKLLVIAEKPSVASDIAKALGGFEKESDYFESAEMVVGSAVGHLLEIVPPEGVEVKRGKWSFAHLPVIPEAFDLKPLPKSEQRLKLLARLLKRKDITGVINACDAGREGELIFRLIMQYTKSKLPIQRLWLQSMTPESIREAFRQLRSDKDLQSLANAARCRSEADWLVGINGTRAMTAFNSKDGGFFLTTVGRVQTPTLSILVDREDLIRRFQAKTYFEVSAIFDTGTEQYTGKWFDPLFSKSEDSPDSRADRLWDRTKADAVMACLAKGMLTKVSEETKPSSQSAPMLFDLTSLQREANARFGFSAKASLGLAQALYEKHKVV